MAWFDRNGTQVAAIGSTGRYERIRRSRDGSAVVFDREGDRAHDIFTLDRERGLTRVVSTVGADLAAVFSPGGVQAIQLTKTDFAESGAVFSPDGRWIAYQSNDPAAAQSTPVPLFEWRAFRRDPDYDVAADCSC